MIRWLAEFVGYPTTTGGVLTSGGSMGNLLCLAAMRQAKTPSDVARLGSLTGPRLLVYISSEGHTCHQRTMSLLGLGSDQLIQIPTTSDFRIDCEKLERQIRLDRDRGDIPIAVIGSGGSTNTGSIDPLNRIADICEAEDLWFHVDGAYGALAARTRIVGESFVGLSRADSLAIDPHKWLFVQLEVGCALIRDARHLRDTFQLTPDYLRSEEHDDPTEERFEWFDYTIQHTREFKALKVWMTLAGYGADRLTQAIDDNIVTMRHFANLVDEAPDFQLLTPPCLSTVCFRYQTRDKAKHGDEAFLTALNSRLLTVAERDGRIFLGGTLIRGRKALRACCVNHRTTRRNVEYLFGVLRELGAECFRSLADDGRQLLCKAVPQRRRERPRSQQRARGIHQTKEKKAP